MLVCLRWRDNLTSRSLELASKKRLHCEGEADGNVNVLTNFPPRNLTLVLTCGNRAQSNIWKTESKNLALDLVFPRQYLERKTDVVYKTAQWRALWRKKASWADISCLSNFSHMGRHSHVHSNMPTCIDTGTIVFGFAIKCSQIFTHWSTRYSTLGSPQLLKISHQTQTPCFFFHVNSCALQVFVIEDFENSVASA